MVSDQEKDKIMIMIKVAAAESKAAINRRGSFLHFATVEQWPARMSSTQNQKMAKKKIDKNRIY